MTSFSRINSVSFKLSDDTSILDRSVKKITTDAIFKANVPVSDGIYTPYLGTTDNTYKCATCGNDKNNCFGHMGHYELNYPVYSPLALNHIIKWLRIICHTCGKMVFGDAKTMKEALNMFTKQHVKDTMYCDNCNAVHPIVSMPQVGTDNYLINVRNYGETENQVLYPHEIGKIYSRIPDELVHQLGDGSHPKSYIIKYVPVPPVNIRPEVSIVGGGKSNINSITALLNHIIKLNENEIVPNVPDSNRETFNKNWNNLFNLVDGLIRRTNSPTKNNLVRVKNVTYNSYAEIMAHKHGRIRENLMGKKIFNVCRSTIKCDPTVAPDEILIPMVFAQTISLFEYVQPYNRDRIMAYINNTISGRYPSARTLIKKSTGAKFAISKMRDRDQIIIENGDVIERDLIDGDIVMFNRQPSTKPSQITGSRILVSRDPSAYAVNMNVTSCDFYQADFDGDAMNIYCVKNPSSRIELDYLSSSSNFFISHIGSTPQIGQTNDSVIGAFLLTRDTKKFDRYHAMSLFANAKYVPEFESGKKEFTGRDIVSYLLKETPVSYRAKPKFYQEAFTPYIPYKDTEVDINIRAGKMISGTLDKSAVGKGGNSNLLHRIAREYGNTRAMQSLFDFQQVIIANNQIEGYTISLADMILSPETNTEIGRIVTDIMNKSYLFTDRLNRGDVIPPIGKTVNQFYEEQQVNILSIVDDFQRPILTDMDFDKNCLLRLVTTGSKGSVNDMYNMISSVGQKVINGERIREDFSYKRTLAYFRRFDPTPESRGYMFSNYLQGTTMTEYVFNAMSSRFDLIVKALNTAATGDQNRNSTKCLEPLVSSNTYGTVQHTTFRMIQPIYGSDGCDTRFLEQVSYPQIFMSNSEFEKEYHGKFKSENEKLSEFREFLQDTFISANYLRGNASISGKVQLPINPEHVAEEIIEQFKDAKGTHIKGDESIQIVSAFCDNLPYALLNTLAEKQQRVIPEHIKYAVKMLACSVQFVLATARGIVYKMTPQMLSTYLATIKAQLIKSLVAPGTNVGVIASSAISDYLTQYMLDAHHRSATGGTSLNMMDKVGEVLKAKSHDKISGSNMYIVPQDNNTDKQKIQILANNIKLMTLRQLVSTMQIFYEKFGKPVHPDFEDEGRIITQFVDKALVKPSSGLIDWCIRFQLDKTSLIIKSITVPFIVSRLRAKFEHLYFVYTDENTTEAIIRVYIKSSHFKGETDITAIRDLSNVIYDTPLRGVSNIIDTTVSKRVYSDVNKDGKIADNIDEFVINTTGTNLSDLFLIKEVNAEHTHTDAIHETAEFLGIEAARQLLIVEMQKIVSSANLRHHTIYADELTWTGTFTGTTARGVAERNPDDVLLRMSYEGPVTVLRQATVDKKRNGLVSNMSSSLMVGNIPKIGSLFNDIVPAPEVITKHIKKATDYLDAL